MTKIVIDIGGSGTRSGIFSDYHVHSIQRHKVESLGDLVQVIQLRDKNIDGIALSIAGFVYAEKGIVGLSRSAPYLQGELKMKLQNFFPNATIYIVNDGEAHALSLLSRNDIKYGAINIALGTSVAFGVINEKQQPVRALSGLNWDIGDFKIKTSSSNPAIWYALGSYGLKELESQLGHKAYRQMGYRLGSFASQLAVLFRPNTIAFSGGIVTKYWNEIQPSIYEEFIAPANLQTKIIYQDEPEAALVGLGNIFGIQY